MRKLYVNFVAPNYDFVTKDLAFMSCRMFGDVLLKSCMYTIPHVEHACSNLHKTSPINDVVNDFLM
jgi:hypothetical protein